MFALPVCLQMYLIISYISKHYLYYICKNLFTIMRTRLEQFLKAENLSLRVLRIR